MSTQSTPTLDADGGASVTLKTVHLCADCGRPTGLPETSLALYGLCCRHNHQYRRPIKYHWTPEKDELLRSIYDGSVGCPQKLARQFGFSAKAVQSRAARLGLVRPRHTKPWTKEEDEFLDAHSGAWTTERIARSLGRTPASVGGRARLRCLSLEVREGYTLHSLTVCFGVSKSLVHKWIRLKLLTGERRTGEGGQVWQFTDEDIARFIRNHPTAFRLSQVDQTWFLDLVTSPKVAA